MRFDLLLERSAEFHAADVRASFQATRLSALLTSQLPSVLDGSPMEAGKYRSFSNRSAVHV